MANFFEGLWGLAKHPFDEAEFMVKGARDVIKGDRSIGDLFGDHQDMMSENITVPLGGRNKITENSDAVAGAVVGGVLAAPLLAAGGSAASGGAAGGAGGTTGATSAFSLGDVSSYFKPGKIAQAMQSGPNSLTGAGGGTDVSTMSKLKGGVKGLFDTGTQDLGALYGDVDFSDGANDELLGMIADTESDIAGVKDEEGVDWEAFSRMLQSIKPAQDQKINMSGGKVGGGFRFDRSLYENDLLTREYQNLYNQPLNNKLT